MNADTHPLQALTPVLREHRVLIAIIVLYSVAAFALYHHFPDNYAAGAVFDGMAASSLLGPVFGLCAYAIYVMLMVRPERLTHYLYTSLCRYLTRARLLHAMPIVLLFPLFICSFTVFKAAVPVLQPFAWDERLNAWDLALHGGVAPWLWLQAVFGHPYLSYLVNFAYHLWFFIVYALLYWLAFNMDQARLRMQFLLSFVLSWILLGSVLAALFSSVGPCFYGQLHPGHDPYAPLMEYLYASNQQVPIWALQVQQLLWDGYRHHNAALGIAAMPSMHVATSVLLALWGWRHDRRAGIALSAFALLIIVGSIHLGWHYAVDGYVGAAGAAAIWFAVGALLPGALPGKAAAMPQPQRGTEVRGLRHEH